MDFWSPVFRQKKILLVLMVFFFAVFFGLFQFILDVQKTTIYFTVKEPTIEKNLPMDPPESASKVAEAIAGWAKDPAFRNQVLKEAAVSIPHFKRKISARKQNRMNVFWTLKFYPEETAYAEKITQGLLTVLAQNFKDLNKNNGYPVSISTPRIAHDLQNFPQSWKAGAALFLAVIFGFLVIYGREVFSGKISFLKQIREIYPESPLLRVPVHVGRHDEKVLEQFILTFDSPRLIGTFPVAEKHFSIAPSDSVDEDIDTPILLIRLGDTPVYELENLFAIFGEEVGLVVFER